MAEIMVLCGFFMIYLVEEITHIVVDKMHHGPKIADVNGHTPSTKVRIEKSAFLSEFFQETTIIPLSFAFANKKSFFFFISQHKN